jgi:copper chaperone CopZ
MTDIQRIDLGLTDANSACSCCAPGEGSESASVDRATDASSTEYLVDGMTCSHCVASVTEELTEVDGVERVAVELRAGAASVVTVTSTRPIDDEAVRAAVEEAGYSLAATGA